MLVFCFDLCWNIISTLFSLSFRLNTCIEKIMWPVSIPMSCHGHAFKTYGASLPFHYKRGCDNLSQGQHVPHRERHWQDVSAAIFPSRANAKYFGPRLWDDSMLGLNFHKTCDWWKKWFVKIETFMGISTRNSCGWLAVVNFVKWFSFRHQNQDSGISGVPINRP